MEYLLTIKFNKEGKEEFSADLLEVMCSRPHGINMGRLFYEVEGIQHGLDLKYVSDFYFVTEKLNELSEGLNSKKCTDANCPVHSKN